MTNRRASATASTNDKALATFVAAKTEIDARLERLKALSDEHFGFDPDAINWGSVGSIESVAADLRRITDFLFGEGEFAK